MKAELLFKTEATLGEGALWDRQSQRLLWVDIEGHQLHRFDPQQGQDQTIDLGESVSTVVPRASGGLVVALTHRLVALDTATGGWEVLAEADADSRDTRFNDGKCDPAGRFWVGTLSNSRTLGAAHLWRLDADHSLHRVLDQVTNSNGLAWSPDQTTMYYIDTGTRRVDAFDYQRETGQIARRRPVLAVPEAWGKPDGMTIDAEGMLWIALWGGGRVICWDPGVGRLRATVDVPAARTTSCAFGGPQLDQLFITTARGGADEAELRQQPQAGSLFVARPNAVGLPAFAFAG